MGKGKDIATIFSPLSNNGTQSYLGTGLHTLGLLNWILQQTGRADVYVSTFSTSEAFLNGFANLKKKGWINHSVLLADLKASRKTLHLYKLMQMCFDSVYLGMNHSKIVLVKNDSHFVSVISSQNLTYGDRAECTMVTTDLRVWCDLLSGLRDIVDTKTIQLNGLFNRLADRNREMCEHADDTDLGFVPFGI